MINYRSLKKLLGETSLERKCRLLFGAALMILITASFWIYASRTRQLVEGQEIQRARALVPHVWGRWHLSKFGESISNKINGAKAPNEDSENRVSEDGTLPEASAESEVTNWTTFKSKFQRTEDFKTGADWRLYFADDTPADEESFEALEAFRNDGEERSGFVTDEETGTRHLRLFAPLRFSASCWQCHKNNPEKTYENGQLLAMASVSLSMDAVESELDRNNVILLSSGIVTTFLAMLVAYAIVRYIIVKPVQHLKDVSDEIARGNLNLRAEINTGDEFEELSQAFNRMLRHMTTVNDELRGVNDNLDGKVDQLAQANMELFKSNALKDEFLATMSHELRTPLNSILGFSDVLSNSANLDDRQQRYVENIRTSGRNLMVQINDLLDIAKIESGQMKLTPGPVNLIELIDSQCGQITPLADQKNIDLRTRYLTDPMPELHQDGGKLRQILTNLLSNALKFTPEGGRVRVSAEATDKECVRICVEDTGIGIPMQEQSEIFEKFRQGTTSAGQRDHVKREFGGTGLGLSIVRELSRLLGGDVHLESEFGKGSMFTVRIPIAAPPEIPATQVPLESASDVTRSITSVDLINTAKEVSDDGDSQAESDLSSVDNDAGPTE